MDTVTVKTKQREEDVEKEENEEVVGGADGSGGR